MTAPCVGCGAPAAGRCAACGCAQLAGRYVTLRLLAQGPYSRVYVARSADSLEVALKELRFSLVPSTTELDAFTREAKLLGRIRHPRVPELIESFSDGEGVATRLYIAQRFVAGTSLAAAVESKGPLGVATVRAIALDVLETLCHLQQLAPPVIHRDIKPANLILEKPGVVAVVDFGAARPVSYETHRSTLVGTFGFMPPEQLAGTVDLTTDVYALAASCLFALRGRPLDELLEPRGGIRVPRALAIDGALRRWLETALSWQRSARFRDARAALDALSTPASSRRAFVATGAVLGSATLVAGGAALFLRRTSQPRVLAPPVPAVAMTPDPVPPPVMRRVAENIEPAAAPAPAAESAVEACPNVPRVKPAAGKPLARSYFESDLSTVMGEWCRGEWLDEHAVAATPFPVIEDLQGVADDGRLENTLRQWNPYVREQVTRLITDANQAGKAVVLMTMDRKCRAEVITSMQPVPGMTGLWFAPVLLEDDVLEFFSGVHLARAVRVGLPQASARIVEGVEPVRCAWLENLNLEELGTGSAAAAQFKLKGAVADTKVVSVFHFKRSLNERAQVPYGVKRVGETFVLAYHSPGPYQVTIKSPGRADEHRWVALEPGRILSLPAVAL